MASGDLNNDGRLDIIWSNGTIMQAWLGTAGGGFAGASLPAYPTGWTLFGIGDMDGDGFDDLFWRLATTGDVAVWRMSGGTRLGGYGFPGSTSWKPIQVADFTGDGRVDIVWTNGTSSQLWQSQGASFTGVAMPNFPTGWLLIRR